MLQQNAVLLHRIYCTDRRQDQRQYQAKFYPHLATANGIPQNVSGVCKKEMTAVGIPVITSGLTRSTAVNISMIIYLHMYYNETCWVMASGV